MKAGYLTSPSLRFLSSDASSGQHRRHYYSPPANLQPALLHAHPLSPKHVRIRASKRGARPFPVELSHPHRTGAAQIAVGDVRPRVRLSNFAGLIQYRIAWLLTFHDEENSIDSPNNHLNRQTVPGRPSPPPPYPTNKPPV